MNASDVWEYCLSLTDHFKFANYNQKKITLTNVSASFNLTHYSLFLKVYFHLSNKTFTPSN